jgi:hypothetical protein
MPGKVVGGGAAASNAAYVLADWSIVIMTVDAVATQ